MMRKLPWFLLAVSVIFNFTFAGGFLQARSEALNAQTERTKPQALADELDLPEKQKETYTSLRARANDRATQLREAILLARQDLWAQIRGASPDREKIQQTQKRLGELYQEYRELAGDHLQEFLSVLRPDQRQMVIDKIRSHDRHHHGDSSFWSRFDTNKDGKLDDAERKKAHETMMKSGPSRWRGRPRGPSSPRTMPAETMQKYDTNKDGKLDKDEQARMREGMRKKIADGFQEFLLKRFDADGDGKLSEAEQETARKAVGPPRGYPKGGPRPQPGTGRPQPAWPRPPSGRKPSSHKPQKSEPRGDDPTGDPDAKTTKPPEAEK